VQAPGESEQHLAPAGSAPARIAVLGVRALADDAIALAPTHQSAHARRPADPGDEAHGFILDHYAVALTDPEGNEFDID
jgi:hypothetical protein